MILDRFTVTDIRADAVRFAKRKRQMAHIRNDHAQLRFVCSLFSGMTLCPLGLLIKWTVCAGG